MAYKIAVVVGSLRKESFNKQLAHALESIAPKDFTFEHLDIGSLPLYSQDYDADYPEVARAFKQKIAEANAVLIVTPEYNRSIPGVIKKRARLGFASVGAKRVGRQAGRADRHVGGRDRHGHRAVAFARGVRLSRYRALESAGNVHQARCESYRCEWEHRERKHAQILARLHG